MIEHETVSRVCADMIRGRETVGRRLFMSTMWIGGDPAWIVCTRKTRRVVAYARNAYDAAVWFLNTDRRGAGRIPRRKKFEIVDEARERQALYQANVRARFTYYEMVLEAGRAERARHLAAARSRFLGALSLAPDPGP